MIRTIQLKRYKLKADLPILLEAEPALCLDTGEVFIGDGVNNIPLSKQGIQGIQGSQGIQGEKGIKGEKGDTGLQGSVGSTGIQGIQGLKGDIGITGASGSQGIQGIKGTDGSNGSQGIQGIQGIKGDTGAQGIQGLTGSGTGDMLKSVYDKDGNGIVDNSDSSNRFNCPDGDRNASNKLPNSVPHQVRVDFANAGSADGGGNYSGVITFSPWDGTTSSTGDASYQLAFNSTATNGGGIPYLSLRKGIDNTWNPWTRLGLMNDPNTGTNYTMGVLNGKLYIKPV
ncbi:collagen-like protein [Clostridium estertheticum]|uniref:Major tropism determinant N-terminal domain-containing protein n=1 Tax=Clostridium estertheticum TaxID=238834 RepID=A0AA47EJF8_9CLOT|nr:collagen-like protein [Clostridium estertheticum]MBU3153890.1 hypothetical protein [Clostridium estertheticum]WAG61334.1 hypothetical protein LL038_03515 [Clostridium estertheticum]